MSFLFNKSSLLASVEILKDKNFKKYKDLNYIYRKFKEEVMRLL